MERLKLVLQHIRKKPSLYFLLFLVIFTFDRHHRLEHSKDNSGTFYSDVFDYYRFLPDIFLTESKTSEPNIKTNRRTIGMAIMYSPAFIVGHVKAKLSGEDCNGYSKPYQWAIRWGSIIYVFIGLVLCRLSLLMFFNEIVTLITLICILFGTNLFYYTYSWGELPHSYLFCLNSVFIYCVLMGYKKPNLKYILFAGFLAGMITLIRPTGIMVLLFPLLYKINSVNDLGNRLKQVFSNKLALIAATCVFMIPVVLQMIFWKVYINRFVYYSYGEEGFFFNDPQVLNFLISYRKGWLVYSPIISFALLGFIVSFKQNKSFFVFNVAFFTVVIYVLSSWWEWSYGGSFGCRAMIEYYAFLAFPFASFVSYLLQINFRLPALSVTLKSIVLIVFWLLIELNLFQSKQVRLGIIHWSGMNKEAYWYCFLDDNFSPADYEHMNKVVTPPDANKMLKGERDF